MVQAGWRGNWIPVIEPRVRLKEPLDPATYNPHLLGRRKRHQFRPDVGYYINGELNTFVECCTTDEAGDYISSDQTSHYTSLGHITKRDVLLHFIQHGDPKVSRLMLCVILPREMKRKPPWPRFKDVGNNFFKELTPGWDGLIQDLQRYALADLIIIEENGVHINKVHYPVNIT